MGNFSKDIEHRKEIKEKNKTRKEKLSDYFFSLSNTLLGSLVVGIVLLFLGNELNEINGVIILCIFFIGLLIVVVSARIGYNILK